MRLPCAPLLCALVLIPLACGSHGVEKKSDDGGNDDMFSTATSWTGIPNPFGTVPAAIMPELPVAGETISAFPYDPIGLQAPQWQDAAGNFYINSGAENCDDDANGARGSPTTPRCSLPGFATGGAGTWELHAGDRVFVVGNGATYGNDSNVQRTTMVGSPQELIWIIGVGSVPPSFRFRSFQVSGGMSHVLWENVEFHSPSDQFAMSFASTNGPVEYITFRGVKCRGSEGVQASASRRCFALGGTEQYPLRFVVFHQVEISGMGRYQDDWDTGVDMHGMQMNKWTRYVWVLNSRIYHVQGDSIQCGNSNWFDFDYAARPHYIYVGGTEFFENYENAWDDKGCYHVVFSHNRVHDFYNSARGANAQAIITQQDGEGYVGGRNVWFINNAIWDVGTAFFNKATTGDAEVYILGNLIINPENQAFGLTPRCNTHDNVTTCPTSTVLSQNTVDCSLAGLALTNVQNPVGSQQTVDLIGNVFYNCPNNGEPSNISFENFSDGPFTITYRHNMNFRTEGGEVSLLTNLFDVYDAEDNSLNEDPLFNNAASGDYTLSTTSAGVDLVAEPAEAYALFEAMYGINIRVDRAGNTWNAQEPINAGAYQ